MMTELSLLSSDEASVALPELMALLRDAVEGGASVGFVLPLSDAALAAYWQDVLVSMAAGKHRLVVARQQGRIIGTVQLAFGQKMNAAHRAEVQKLLVHRTMRRQGIANQLMQRLESEARSTGLKLLYLDTRQGDPAEDLYRQLGYTTAGVIPAFALSPDQTTLDATVYMFKLLK
ncbi:MAG: GNAT family N-acetyltransferase [Armatimonadetes bacterium]|nr:GNAT family N-acetyltransferase [Anaerolineae bacterium]